MDHSPLGKLSPGLRNEIYAYVLPGDAAIPIIENSDGIQAPLTRVCKSSELNVARGVLASLLTHGK